MGSYLKCSDNGYWSFITWNSFMMWSIPLWLRKQLNGIDWLKYEITRLTTDLRCSDNGHWILVIYYANINNYYIVNCIMRLRNYSVIVIYIDRLYDWIKLIWALIWNTSIYIVVLSYCWFLLHTFTTHIYFIWWIIYILCCILCHSQWLPLLIRKQTR